MSQRSADDVDDGCEGCKGVVGAAIEEAAGSAGR